MINQATADDFRINRTRALIDRFKLVYDDNHTAIYECQLCRHSLRFTNKASIATIKQERAQHVCRKVA